MKNAKNDIQKNVKISLQLSAKLKIMKKSMTISLQTYEKKGVCALFDNQYRSGRVTKVIVFVKKALGFM